MKVGRDGEAALAPELLLHFKALMARAGYDVSAKELSGNEQYVKFSSMF